MNKITDILDGLWLNISILTGSIAILTGILLGWNNCLSWLLFASLYGVILIFWVFSRFIKICKSGISTTKTEADIPEVKPGLDRNALKEFLQPVSFACFFALIGVNWVEFELAPKWAAYALIGVLLLLLFANIHYYRNRDR